MKSDAVMRKKRMFLLAAAVDVVYIRNLETLLAGF